MSPYPPSLSLWTFKNTPSASEDPNHHTALINEPCSDEASSILYYFPGFKVTPDETGNIPEKMQFFAKATYQTLEQSLSALTDNDYAIQLVTYPDVEFMPPVRHLANEDPFFISPEFIAFTRDHVLPQIRAGKKVTLLGYSAGTTAIEMVERSLIHILREEGKSEEDISTALAAVVAIHTGPVNAHCVKDGSSPQFTSVVFNNMQDSFAKEHNTAFSSLLPDTKDSSNALSIHTKEKTVIITSDYDAFFPYGNHSFFHLPDKLNWKDKVFLQRHSWGKGHTTAHFMERNSDIPSGVALAFERIIKNAVNREGTTDIQTLLEKEPPQLPANHYFSAKNSMPFEARHLKDAVTSWVEHTRKAPAPKQKAPAL